MQQPETESVKREREQWHKRACEFRALAMAARQEFDNDDALWFEQAYQDALNKYDICCRALEQGWQARPLAA